ncbi:unnamed protein product [Brachionus calyciflorus]|uniref:Uncharacterized protein n=1 Tax=Brachionus calyciflorus TaxID=104777 RepID=A0A814BR02_9BILA|nr:unnamed protein product [Brachionus calyciflorus]
MCSLLFTKIILCQTYLNDADTNQNNKTIFIDNKTECQMYQRNCFVKITSKYLIRYVNMIPSKSKLFEFNQKSFKKCSLNQTLSKECSKLKNHIPLNKELYLLNIKPKLVGRAYLDIEYLIDDNYSRVIKRHIIVIKSPKRFIDVFQIFYISFVSFLVAIIMGILLDTESLIQIIKMPIPVIVGFLSQYLLMPLLTFGFIKIFKLKPIEALALFIYGCSPGGVGSNNWTIIFNGDIDLSAILTFVSTMSSIIMMPLWFYTLGKTISIKAEIKIPLFKLILNLLVTIIPCLIGIILAKKFPKLKQTIMKYAKKIIVFMIISFLVLNLVSKYYIFKLITWQQWVTGPLIPWSGFAFGAFFAWITRRPIKQIYTISIETGLQNVSIAFLIIMLNFESPDSDYALLPLIAVSTITTVPLWILFLINKFISRKNTKSLTQSSDFIKCNYNKNDIKIDVNLTNSLNDQEKI